MINLEVVFSSLKNSSVASTRDNILKIGSQLQRTLYCKINFYFGLENL